MKLLGDLKHAYWRIMQKIDDRVCKGRIGVWFCLEGSDSPDTRKGAKFWTEVNAGLTTFATCAYIISVNATMLADTGGTCICPGTADDPYCDLDPVYAACILDFKRQLVTATAIVTALATITFGVVTNLPCAIAPGMGLNAYFTYQVVGRHGSGSVPYRVALTAVFVEGFIFIALALIGMRQWLVRIIPNSIKIAAGAGIGLFLTEVGLSTTGGIGMITSGGAQPTAIGGCPSQYFDPKSHTCLSHKMRSPQMWCGIVFGGFLTAYLMAYRYKLAIIIGILTVSILSWPRTSPFTYFDDSDLGNARFEFFTKLVGSRGMKDIFVAQDWSAGSDIRQFALALFTFLYVDIVDCTATMHSMARFAGVTKDETGDFPRSTIAYCTDALFISIGSLFGVSPVTVFVESGAGVSQGGKTGLTAVVTGTGFLISIGLAPIFASIPPWATGCTLILVGMMMMAQIRDITWDYIGDAVPVFVTIAFMPLTYSVAYGLIAGLMTYTIINGAIAFTTVLSSGKVLPDKIGSRTVFSWKYTQKEEAPPFIRAGEWVLSKLSSKKSVATPKSEEIKEDVSPTPSNRTQFGDFHSTPVEMRSVL